MTGTPAADGAAPGAQAARRAAAERLVKIAFGVAVLAFGAGYVAARWPRLSVALHRADPGWVLAAVGFAVLGQWAAALGFRAVLAAVDRWLPVRDVARVFFVSQLGKYIPGSVWPILAVTQMCRRYGVARAAAAVAGLLALGFSLATAVALGAVLVLTGAAGSAAGVWWLALLVPVLAAAVHPRVVAAGVRAVLRLTRRPPVPVALTGAALRGTLGWPVASWLLLGLHCWALVVAFGGPVLGSLAAAIGGFALAYAAGTLFVPAPAGAGVREAVLGVALAGVLGSRAGVSHDMVIVVVLASRVLLAVLDFAQAGAAVAADRVRRGPPAPDRPVPAQ